MLCRLPLMSASIDAQRHRFITTVHASGIESKHIHDLPMTRMSQLFNVDHFVVSQARRSLRLILCVTMPQVNPHMVASVRASKSSSRFGLVHRLMMGIGREWHHWFRQIINIDMLPRYLYSLLDCPDLTGRQSLCVV